MELSLDLSVFLFWTPCEPWLFWQRTAGDGSWERASVVQSNFLLWTYCSEYLLVLSNLFRVVCCSEQLATALGHHNWECHVDEDHTSGRNKELATTNKFTKSKKPQKGVNTVGTLLRRYQEATPQRTPWGTPAMRTPNQVETRSWLRPTSSWKRGHNKKQGVETIGWSE